MNAYKACLIMIRFLYIRLALVTCYLLYLDLAPFSFGDLIEGDIRLLETFSPPQNTHDAKSSTVKISHLKD